MNHRPYNHTCNMLDQAQMLWDEADRMTEVNIRTQKHIYAPAWINDIQDMAADLERFAHWPVEFAVEAPECTCKLPEESCPICDALAAKVYADEMELL